MNLDGRKFLHAIAITKMNENELVEEVFNDGERFVSWFIYKCPGSPVRNLKSRMRGLSKK